MAGITDVAKLAGVSVSTVSLVCNKKGYVSDATREKVLHAMAKLDYTPSQLGRNLKRQRSGIIGVIVPDAAHPFFATFIKRVERELHTRGYKTMVCGTAGREEVEQGYLDMLEQHTMDALIMGAHSLDVARYASATRPLITLDRLLSNEIPTIRADKLQIARLAARLFLECGRRKIVQIVSSGTIRSYDDSKDAEFRHLLECEGVEVIDIPVGFNCFTVEDYQAVAKRVFDEVSDADGILGTDLAAMMCLQEARCRGRFVPDDLSVVAIDGTYVTRATERVVTAIVQPVEQFACAAAAMVTSMVENKTRMAEDQVFEVTLQEGETL